MRVILFLLFLNFAPFVMAQDAPLSTSLKDGAKASAVKREVAPPPEKATPVRIARFDSAPTIDGRLDDEVWERATILKDFYQIQPGDNIAPSKSAQVLLGWAPNPGTSFYAGYNDDITRNGYSPFTDQFEPGFRRNGRTFFIKMSYLIRRSF